MTSLGKSFPLGATVYPEGVNFAIYSKSSTGLELLLFDGVEEPTPSRVITFDPSLHRTFHYWHIFVRGLGVGQVYGFRAHGPLEPNEGHRFDASKVLLDPYSRAVAIPSTYERQAGARPGDDTATAMRSVVAEAGTYDWEGDAPLKRPFSQTVIYELHVAGFTRHLSSGLAAGVRGTYAGLVEKIPYLQDLGITAVELLPVFQYDEQEAPPGLSNYWGYNPVSFFAAHSGYSSRQDPLGPLNEFRDMVKALHQAGIEVILDVVYNHTAESDETGPTFCFRGLENRTYYILGEATPLDGDQDGLSGMVQTQDPYPSSVQIGRMSRDLSRYANYSGTGNTLNSNHSVVRRMILDSLHYWVEEMHVDGFRFDLASILSRDQSGQPLANPPILWDIETDPVLAGTKLIAEAWDAAGLYQVGTFVGDRWKEWNGRFRDDIRSYVKGDPSTVSKLAARFLASPDLYGHEEREPEQSINFVTSHDGFTLNDLVSYNDKHNEANLEGNRDGHSDNLSWNCGVEGPTTDPGIGPLRNRQIKNFLSITLLALGTPMLLMGDEVRRTQLGNNNAYCQNNEISWFDWTLLEQHAGIHRFVKQLIHFRRGLSVYKEEREVSLIQLLLQSQLQWHGVDLQQPDWRWNSHSLAFAVEGRRGLFHLIMNAYWEHLEFELPLPPDGAPLGWQRVIDTSLDPPDDIQSLDAAPVVEAARYRVGPRSVVLLIAMTKK